MRKERLHTFIGFLENLRIHEAWLSETKPSTPYFWDEKFIITSQERADLIKYQDDYNKKGKLTFNYLGHFEHGLNFGCNAGGKMIYIDAFGEVSPCVFTPMTFGNVAAKSVREIYDDMKQHFKPQKNCFINTNVKLFKKYYQGISPIPLENAVKIAAESAPDALPEFNRIQEAA
jgi:MoaA/NifB/PqqE/SkfB family radical SAM enzyme